MQAVVRDRRVDREDLGLEGADVVVDLGLIHAQHPGPLVAGLGAVGELLDERFGIAGRIGSDVDGWGEGIGTDAVGRLDDEAVGRDARGDRLLVLGAAAADGRREQQRHAGADADQPSNPMGAMTSSFLVCHCDHLHTPMPTRSP